jgi:hypothetical protein
MLRVRGPPWPPPPPRGFTRVRGRSGGGPANAADTPGFRGGSRDWSGGSRGWSGRATPPRVLQKSPNEARQGGARMGAAGPVLVCVFLSTGKNGQMPATRDSRTPLLPGRLAFFKCADSSLESPSRRKRGCASFRRALTGGSEEVRRISFVFGELGAREVWVPRRKCSKDGGSGDDTKRIDKGG